jgi:hypothetical protein
MWPMWSRSRLLLTISVVQDMVYNLWVIILGFSCLSYMTYNLTLSSLDWPDGGNFYLYILKTATCSIYYSNWRQRGSFYTYMLYTKILCIYPHSNDRHLQYIVAHRMRQALYAKEKRYPCNYIRHHPVKSNGKLKMQREELNSKTIE